MSTAPSTAAASTATPLVVTVYLPCSSPLSSNSTTTQSTTTESSSVFNLFYIGLIMALGQSVLNGFNYLFNKMAQNRVARSGPSAAEGSFRYCCQPLWWLSLLLSASSLIPSAQFTLCSASCPSASVSATHF